MSQLDIKFFSESLNRYTSFSMYIPDNKRNYGGCYDKSTMKTLFLLHGYAGDYSNWMPLQISEKLNFSVVIPNGENSFWLDRMSTGQKYCTFIGSELVNYVRKTFGLALSAEDTAIMGYSMGGFGALHTALVYPETFGKVAALSSALILHSVSEMKPGDDNGIANYDYYRECFGELKNLIQSDNNPETLVKRLLEQKSTLPEIYMACGTDDFLLENNRQFHDFLLSCGVNHTYIESKGAHDMTFWNEYAVKFAEEMFG